jgi:hypothetical protein
MILNKWEAIRAVFNLNHLPLVYDQLAKLGVDAKAIEADFEYKFKHQSYVSGKNTFFLLYGCKSIEPLLNEKLNRKFDHPTFRDMILYLLKEEIDKNPYLQGVTIK